MIRREDSLEYHAAGRLGKIELRATKPCLTPREMRLAYLPGATFPSREIAADPQAPFRYTARGNLVGVITNGTAVAGLGPVGPLAAKPMQEGIAVLFKRLADIDVFVIDGQEDPIAVIYAAKLPEAGQKYLTLRRHVYSALVFIANKAFIDGLPPVERKVVIDCARTASLQGRSFIRDNEVRQISYLKAAGMQVEEKPDLEAFRKATAPVIDSASGDTKKLVEQIQQTVK